MNLDPSLRMGIIRKLHWLMFWPEIGLIFREIDGKPFYSSLSHLVKTRRNFKLFSLLTIKNCDKILLKIISRLKNC